MRVYRERLGVPVSWWLVITGCAALLGTTLWAGLSLRAAVIIYASLEGACAAALLGWGAAMITVTDTDLIAGRRRLPLALVAGAAALDAEQTRALRGPRADPAAVLLVRPYLSRAVYVEVAGRPPDQPYWLIGTRRPGDLAAAIERAAASGRGEPARADAGDAASPAPGAVG